MKALISTATRRLAWTTLAFLLAAGAALWLTWRADPAATQLLTDGDLMKRFLALPALLAGLVLISLTACVHAPAASTATIVPLAVVPAKPFMAQVVGLQWLNPLHRSDYPTEWELLWVLGLAKPNKNDDMVKAEPELFTKIQTIGMIAGGNDGRETFEGYHEKYINELLALMHDIYFADPLRFYNVHGRNNKKNWREMAGIRVEYALPEGKLDPVDAANFVRQDITETFSIGNKSFPNSWTRSTPPDVRVTMGGANAGFISLKAGLDYLQAHPQESVWVMNWDAPSRPKDKQIDENLVLLVLAGPDFDTGRAALAWVGYPAAARVDDFEVKKGLPPRVVQAWQATVETAAHNGGKQDTDIAYVIHDANITQANSGDRIGSLAHALTLQLLEFDFMKQTFNTPAVLGEMGAGTALTNVALAIAYANHFGKNVLVAGTSDAGLKTGVVVVPPGKVRPIKPDEDWFRARSGRNAYLFWWGLRDDAEPGPQGYSR